MDKWVVNNFVVQMRSSVTQARVHILNKQIREIKKLKNKNGTIQQKEKNCRKAERLQQEVVTIKKLGVDEISKYALLCTEDPSDILQKDSLPSEERAKVRFAAHKSVALQVRIFRKKHVDWELKLPPLLVQLGLKNKYKKKLSANQNENVKQNERELVTVSENENELCVSVGESKKNESKGDNNLASHKQTDPHTKMLTKQLEKRNKDDSITEVSRFADLLKSYSDVDDSTKIASNEDNDLSSSANLTVKRENHEDSGETSNKQVDCQYKILIKQFKKKKKKEDIAEVRRFADLLESNSDSEDSTEVTSTKDNYIADSTSATTDPFFLVGDESAGSDEDGVNSEESSKKKPENNSKQFSFLNKSKPWEHENIKRTNWNDSVEKNCRRSQWNSNYQEVPIMNRKQRRLMERASAAETKANFASTQNHISPSQPSQLSMRKNLEYHQGKIDFKPGDSVETEMLHPSWAAKRKQRELQIVVPFQGKKIKFDVD